MTLQPGGLEELVGAGASAWDDCVGGLFGTLHRPPAVVPLNDPRAPDRTSLDWTGNPARVECCIGRRNAHRLVDHRVGGVDVGRIKYQEEYLEWRVVRGPDDLPRRIEMTTELADYWTILAAHQPAETIALVEQFAGRDIEASDIYGGVNPSGPGIGPKERREAFERTMVPKSKNDHDNLSPYNSGEKAICFMIHESNRLPALLKLVAAATHPKAVTDTRSNQRRWMTGSEALQSLSGGEDCRNSDPLMVERLVCLASEGRYVTVDEPVGVYISGVALGALITPDGQDVPNEWFEMSRGLGPRATEDGRARCQRLSFEVPQGEGFGLHELKLKATGEPIRYGSQIAELVEVAVHLRTGGTGKCEVDLDPLPIPKVLPCSEQPICVEIRKDWERCIDGLPLTRGRG